MKTLKIISSVLFVGLLYSVLTSCQDTPKITTSGDILPKSLSVPIPSSLSNSTNGVSTGRIAGRVISGRTQGDTLKGNDIYQNLNTFIAVGAAASIVVDEFIDGIRQYHIDRILSLTYVSNDDNRTKNLVVTSQVSFEGSTWDYQLTITDADAQGQADGGVALQIFWNKLAPVKGIAIIKPYNCDRIKNANSGDAVFRIDYTEASTLGYDSQMEVRIAGLPLGNPLTDPFAIGSLHMFAGKKGDVVDVFGNSNHPNGVLFSGPAGFNYAFVASGSNSANIGVAEVGLPPSDLDDSDRTVLLKQYSIKNVFTTAITSIWPGIDQNVLAAYLSNTAAPGYFNSSKGFLSGGVSPGADWDALAGRLNALSPYNPLQTSKLEVTFK
jgi:hypothetical protein